MNLWDLWKAGADTILSFLGNLPGWIKALCLIYGVICAWVAILHLRDDLRQYWQKRALLSWASRQSDPPTGTLPLPTQSISTHIDEALAAWGKQAERDQATTGLLREASEVAARAWAESEGRTS
jgi:hypothetical protein